MKALVLAAGYATRLRPLTDETAKPLLPLAGRPMIDFICDRIDEVSEVDELHVVTNSRFAAAFEAWAKARSGRLRPRIHDDGTRSNEERLGAISDIAFVVEQAELAGDDLLVVAGDNLFDFSLVEQVACWRSKGNGSCLAVYRCPDRIRLSAYGIVELGEDDRVVGFVEKPAKPASNLIATAAYVFSREHIASIPSYLAEGNSPDQPGHFVAWLHPNEPVYGFVFDELWLDIGDHDQLRQADEIMSSRGKPCSQQPEPLVSP
jgi:glucose-1-phosphate thymidylyltransferase